MIKKSPPYLMLFVAWAVVVWIFILDYQREDGTHNQAHLDDISSIYRFATKNYEHTAKLFFKNTIDTEQNKKLLKNALRQKLYDGIKYDFANLGNAGFSNVTFTDAKGNVILRMHDKDKYGDNLAKYRALLAKTLKSKEPSSGFEIGRLHSGISFCYPLMLDKELIGAIVETVPLESVVLTLNERFRDNFDFIVAKSRIDKNVSIDIQKEYAQSLLSSKFVRNSKLQHDEIAICADKLVRDNELLDMESFKPQVAHVKCKDSGIGVALLPIKNSDDEAVAYFVQYSSGAHMEEVRQRLFVKLAIVSILFVAILVILLRQKKLFARIEESERYYKTLFEDATIGVCHVSTEGMFLRVNRKLCDILGYTEEELLRTDVWSVTYHEDISASIENMNALVSKKIKSYTLGQRYVKKSGEPIWVRVGVGYLSYNNENPKYLISTVESIDEEMTAKQFIDIQRKQMNAILEAIPSMVFIKNKEHRMIYANAAACAFLGFDSIERLKGKSTFDLVSQGEAEKLFEDEERVFRNGETLANFKEKITGADGISRVILSHRQPFMLENGEAGLLGISTDITSIYEARRTSELLRKFFDNTKEAMVIADETGKIQRVNTAFTLITGYAPQEAVGQNLRTVKAEPQDKESYEMIWSELTQNGRWVGEIYDRRKNGELYPEWLSINAIKDDSGKITNYISTFIDLTKIKEDEATIKRQAELLVSQSRYAAMGEMIGMIAHQWRQPITAIGMAANNMMLDVELGDINAQMFRKHLESIDAQVQFLSHTIDDFRNFFKPQTESTVVKIGTVIKNALKIIGKSLENNNIAVTMNTGCDKVCNSENCDISVEAHEGELVQAFLVFLGNAKDILLDSVIKNPTITVGCTPYLQDGFVEISVCDNGGGVPNELMTKIFEPYFTTKSAKNGTGLGLYIAKTIVEKHQGGSIGVRNDEGGACFWIRLPIKPQQREGA